MNTDSDFIFNIAKLTSDAAQAAFTEGHKEGYRLGYKEAMDAAKKLIEEHFRPYSALDAPDDEPEEDGECFRGGEAAAFEAEGQARIQRELK